MAGSIAVRSYSILQFSGITGFTFKYKRFFFKKGQQRKVGGLKHIKIGFESNVNLQNTMCMNMICKAHRQRHIVPGIVHGITQAKDVDKDNYNYKEAELLKKKHEYIHRYC